MIDPLPFPIDAFPTLPFNAGRDVYNMTKAPHAMIAASIIGVMSMACQQQICVRRFNGLVSPVHLYIATIAESGERKTTCDYHLTKPIRDLELEYAEKMRPLHEKFVADYAVWKSVEQGLKTAIRRATENDESSSSQCTRLAEHICNIPKEPVTPRFLLGDVTPAALHHHLSVHRAAGIISSEAGAIFDGRTFSNLGILNALWSGESIQLDRKSSPTITLSDANLTLSLMVQPDTFRKFLDGKGSNARDIGLLARCLICRPLSTQGFRYEDGRPTGTTGLQAFHDRIDEILRKSIDSRPCRITLEFSPQAQSLCHAYTNSIEASIAPGGFYADIRDFAAKLADNMARISALFHFVEGGEGAIDVDSVTRATQITDWFALEFKRNFGKPYVVPQEIQDAQMLEAKLVSMASKKGQMVFKKTIVQQHAPSSLRDIDRFGPALITLANSGRVRLFKNHRTQWIELLPIQIYPVTPACYSPPQSL